MIEETARVIGIEGSQLLLEADIKTSCQSCSASQGCGTALLTRHIGRKMTRFRADNSVNAGVGDQVVVGLEERAMLGGSLLVYLYPLLVMILAALAADAVLDPGAYARDLQIAAAGFAGLALTVFAVRRRLAGRRSQQRLTPVVLRKNIEYRPAS